MTEGQPVFQLGFTKSDVVRSVWAFVLPFLVVFAVSMLGVLNTLITSCNDKCDWSGATSAAIAGVIALGSAIAVGVKNYLLANGPVKG
jgi:hypothetical protein